MIIPEVIANLIPSGAFETEHRLYYVSDITKILTNQSLASKAVGALNCATAVHVTLGLFR